MPRTKRELEIVEPVCIGVIMGPENTDSVLAMSAGNILNDRTLSWGEEYYSLPFTLRFATCFIVSSSSFV